MSSLKLLDDFEADKYMLLLEWKCNIVYVACEGLMLTRGRSPSDNNTLLVNINLLHMREMAVYLLYGS